MARQTKTEKKRAKQPEVPQVGFEPTLYGF